MGMSITPEQMLINHLGAEYSGLQIKHGVISTAILAGDNDKAGVVLDTKFPNGVLFGWVQPDWVGGHWNYLFRAHNQPYHAGANLVVDIHTSSTTTGQTVQLRYTVFGY